MKIDSILQETKLILKEHSLCDSCLGRILGPKLGLTSHKRLGKKIRDILKQQNPKSCYICKNMMLTLDVQLEKMLAMSKDYDFSSFLIGAVLRPSILDRDDLIRSKFKLRGIHSIKNDVTREIGKRFGRKTRTTVNYKNPDIVFMLDFKNEECEIKPKPVFVYGRYTKTVRGIPQKQKPCENCNGKGCFVCEFHGIIEYDSVEGKIANFLFKKFEAQKVKITWVGSEDEASMVLGKGRPFFAKLFNPHKREISFGQKVNLKEIVIKNLKTVEKIPNDIIRFTSEIEMNVETEKEVESSQLKKLYKLKDQPIFVYENSGKRNQKKIYQIRYKKISTNSFSVFMEADGGIPLKRFVNGFEVAPSLTSILENQCKCQVFDFHKVTIVN